MNHQLEEFHYDDAIVRKFVIATLFWGAVAFLIGLAAAMQLANWKLNFGLEWITYGRLRPIHTNAAIFAFAGNTIFAGIYYSSQRLLKARMFSDLLSKVHFWGWQLLIVLAAVSLALGYTQGKEYAELEWPLDIMIAVIWIIFGINFFGTLIRRRVKHMYAGLWFYVATIITVAVLHVFNSLEIPVGWMNSYPIYSGAQDALVQWWYGHNAVAFFLTTPFLGLMYYFVPKIVNRPIYSYKMSIIHFWSLVLIYIWAGPHHLLYTALPEWAQTLGMVFSLMLWVPSWAGMFNGLFTIREAWQDVKSDPIVKMLVAGLTFYGMSTFEGPLLSIKSVSALGHYTDWIVGHVHSGTLGWNGLIGFAVMYYLVPKLWKTKLYSIKLVEYHFWIALSGTILYVTSMWAAGISQGLMWREMDEFGKLVYPDFITTVVKILPLYWFRAVGGTLFVIGYFIMLYNLVKTIKTSAVDLSDEKTKFASQMHESIEKDAPHRKLEALPISFAVLSLVAILIGSLIEIVPTFLNKEYIGKDFKIRPYTPLQLSGRDLYVREGCYTCHSQMIRPMVHEVLRYGPASKAEESMYDRPFQWGSKRTGPDLARLGGKYSNTWHYQHMINPRDLVPESIMPSYPWLAKKKLKTDNIERKLSVMKTLGVPYSDENIAAAKQSMKEEAAAIVSDLESTGITNVDPESELVALIAYLQSLGKLAEK